MIVVRSGATVHTPEGLSWPDALPRRQGFGAQRRATTSFLAPETGSRLSRQENQANRQSGRSPCRLADTAGGILPNVLRSTLQYLVPRHANDPGPDLAQMELRRPGTSRMQVPQSPERHDAAGRRRPRQSTRHAQHSQRAIGPKQRYRGRARSPAAIRRGGSGLLSGGMPGGPATTVGSRPGAIHDAVAIRRRYEADWSHTQERYLIQFQSEVSAAATRPQRTPPSAGSTRRCPT